MVKFRLRPSIFLCALLIGTSPVVLAKNPDQHAGSVVSSDDAKHSQAVKEAAGPAKEIPPCEVGTDLNDCYKKFVDISKKLSTSNPALFKRLADDCRDIEGARIISHARNLSDVELAKRALIEGDVLTDMEKDFFASIGTAYGEARNMTSAGVVSPAPKKNSTEVENPVVRANMIMVYQIAKNRVTDKVYRKSVKKIKLDIRAPADDSRAPASIPEPALARVLLQDRQFSCWNEKIPNSPCLLTLGQVNYSPDVELNIRRALKAYLDFQGDYGVSEGLKTATHYYLSSLDGMTRIDPKTNKKERASPEWSWQKREVDTQQVFLPPPPKPPYLVDLKASSGERHKFYNKIDWAFRNEFDNPDQ